MKNWFKKQLYPFVLFLTSLVTYVTNYRRGTFLVGWDNEFPEFNFAASAKMNLFSVWQEYRGVGVEDGMAHAANLLHTAYIFILSFILPMNMLRYTFHFATHFLGGLGMYFLLTKIFKKNPLLAFFGALFYQFNITTIQMFFAPLEVFSMHFAALPWLLMMLFFVLEHPTRKNYLLFLLTSLLFTPQSFVPTVFIAYITLIGSILGVELIRHKLNALKKVITIVALIFAANAFWLLPFMHAATQQSSIIKNTKINQTSSEAIYEKNKARGGLIDVLQLKGFMLDITEWNHEKPLDYIMKDWNNHLTQPLIFLLSTMFAVVCGYGVIKAISQTREHKEFTKELYLVPILGISIFMLGTRIPVLSSINEIIRTIFPLFGEVFRFPFTKFSLVYACAYTILLVYGVEHLSRIKYRTQLIVAFIICLGIYTFPTFRGNFFYDMLRLQVPKPYFETMEYFKREPTGRVMTLPQPSFSNWTAYKWGARGSGFLWHGIAQPTLDRAFDPWSSHNEQYFNEVFSALSREDKTQFQRIVDKYDINYILIDSSFNSSSKAQNYEKLQGTIEDIFPSATKTQFGSGATTITVYKLPYVPFVTVKTNTVSVGSPFHYEYVDTVYQENGDYVYGSNWDSFYLFPSLFTNKTQDDLEFEYSFHNSGVTITSKNKISAPESESTYYLEVPPLGDIESFIPVTVVAETNQIRVSYLPINIRIGDTEYSIKNEDQLVPLPNATQVEDVTLREKTIKSPLRTLLYYPQTYDPSNLFTIHYTNGTTRDLIINPTIGTQPQEVPIEIPPGEHTVSVTFPVIDEIFDGKNVLDSKNYVVEAPCKGTIRSGLSLFHESPSITFSANNSTICFHQYLKGIKQYKGAFIYIDSKRHSGLPIGVQVDNPQQKVQYIDSQLHIKTTDNHNLLIIPPTSEYSYTDYGLHLSIDSPGKTYSQYELFNVRVGNFPYSFLKGLKITSTKPRQMQKEYYADTEHPAQFMYSVSVPDEPFQESAEPILYVSQGFHSGWMAYEVHDNSFLTKTFPFIGGQKLEDHQLVNNWANGWRIDKETKNVVIIFWPQYLFFLGAFLTIPILGIVLLKSK